jgi:hypothetical protein
MAEFTPSPALKFPVVGVGASVGGADTFRRFLSVLPANTGMAFVLIQHLDLAGGEGGDRLPGEQGGADSMGADGMGWYSPSLEDINSQAGK